MIPQYACSLIAEEQQRFELVANMANISEVTADIPRDLENLRAKQTSDQRQLTAQITNINTAITNMNTAVDFSARLTTDSIPRNSPIKYTNVQLNKGDRYSSSTGKFTADRAGL